MTARSGAGVDGWMTERAKVHSSVRTRPGQASTLQGFVLSNGRGQGAVTPPDVVAHLNAPVHGAVRQM